MLGIDLGSRRVKIVKMTENGILQSRSFDTINFFRKYGKMVEGSLHIDMPALGLSETLLIATGYGKTSVRVEGARNMPEIQAHAAGAVYQSSERDFTLLDIGGQDTKVIQVRGGRPVDFLTNDRCAAGSGRYLENMAAVLGISLEGLASYADVSIELNATCAIFAETEIIARVIEGYSTAQLGAGVNYALYRRIAPLLKKLPSPVYIMAGGGAKSWALQQIAARDLQAPVIALADPEFNGAIGCCVIGREMDSEAI
ncbi:MAG: acyl-CoA dehydratase activase [Syntrophomonadaceae bacterium]